MVDGGGLKNRSGSAIKIDSLEYGAEAHGIRGDVTFPARARIFSRAHGRRLPRNLRAALRDVYCFALFLSGHPSKDDDLAAETFIRAWTARSHPAGERPLVPADDRPQPSRDQLRGSGRYVPIDESFVADTPGPDMHAVHASSLWQIRAGLRNVARGDRRALLLHWSGG